MNVIELIRYRNHLPRKLRPLCDWYIHRELGHIPILGELLKNPPPPPLAGPETVKIRKEAGYRNVFYWLSEAWLNFDIEYEKRCRRVGTIGQRR